MATLSDGNFTGLRTSLGEWLHRSDLSNTDLGNFIWLFEKDFNASLRVKGMEAQTTIASTSGYLPHPSDWQAWKNITIAVGNLRYQLNPMSEEQWNNLEGLTGVAQPRGYVVRGDRTYLVAAPDSSGYSYQTTYYQGVTNLSGSASTNWLLTKFPMVYLYGSLLQAQAFAQDDREISKWEAAFNSGMSNVLVESQRASFGGGTLQITPDRFY